MTTAFQANAFQNNAFQIDGGVVVPPTPTPTPATVDGGGVGRAAWRDHYKRKSLPKKKKKLLEELDDALIELQARIEETNNALAEAEYLKLANAEVAELTLADLRAYLATVQEAIQDIDDEEVLLLAIH